MAIEIKIKGKWQAIAADAAFAEQAYPGAWREVPDAPAPDAPPEARRITRLAFRNRFSTAEKTMIEFLSLDDPSAPIEQRQQAAGLRAYLKDVDSATFIDLDDAATAAGVQTLEAAGLLDKGRADEILQAPVQPGEVYP